MDQYSAWQYTTVPFAVSLAQLSTISITPANGSVQQGQTVQLTATGNYSDSSTVDLTYTVTWVSNDTSTAVISNAAGTKGLATGVISGKVNVKADLGSTEGNTFLRVVGQSARVIFSAQPPTTVGAHTPFQVTVQLQDSSGNPVSAGTSQVTLTLANNNVGARLEGSTVLNTTNGLATFTVAVDAPQTSYTLVANSTALLAGSSSAFTVYPQTVQFVFVLGSGAPRPNDLDPICEIPVTSAGLGLPTFFYPAITSGGIPINVEPEEMAVSPDGTTFYAYVQNNAQNGGQQGILPYSINPISGQLTQLLPTFVPIKNFLPGDQITGPVVVDSQAKTLFVGILDNTTNPGHYVLACYTLPTTLRLLRPFSLQELSEHH